MQPGRGGGPGRRLPRRHVCDHPGETGVPYFDDGVAAFLAALPVHIAKEMFLTARPLSAEDAHRWGW